ncbi:MAG: ABC transporter ATP-binding protein, partial [Burkholderiales bacterium]
LAPLVVEALRERIGDLKRDGMTILLAEQSVEFCLQLADRVYVLGQVRYQGTAGEFRANSAIREQYLEL